MNAQTKSRFGRLLSVLALPLLALSLLLALSAQSQTGHAQSLTQSQLLESASLTGATPTPESSTASPEAVPTPDCYDPIPGHKVKLFGEDEIVVACRSDSGSQALEYATLDNSGQNLIWGGNRLYTGDLTNVRWPAVTMADLNADGKSEAVMAFRDKQERIAVTTIDGREWYEDGSYYKGGNVEWLDIAAGDLDRSGGDDEVVITYSDNYHDIRMNVLDGNSQGAIAQSPNSEISEWADGVNYGRGDVDYVAVVTGDLNGDGYDDEIVTAFQDGNNDLQVLILRYTGSNSLALIWNRAWTDHDRGDVGTTDYAYGSMRPIDVTTGDVDGDKRDEVIVGFRDGSEQTQLLILDYKADGTYDDRVFVQRDAEGPNFRAGPTSVSVSAADLDGDGQAEIALGYNVVYGEGQHDYWQQHLVTYDYVPQAAAEWQRCTDDSGYFRPCLQARSGSWTSAAEQIPYFVSEVNPEALVVVDTGDLDGDGKAEIALIRQEHDTGDAWVLSFDADTGLTQRSSWPITWNGTDRVQEFWLAMGDQNGDSRYGTYMNNCYLKWEAQVTSLIHAPPYWTQDTCTADPAHLNENCARTQAAIGTSVSQGGGTGKATETMVGGSVKLATRVHEIGPSFTYEWEKSCAAETTRITSTVQGIESETLSMHDANYNAEEAYSSAVELVKIPYWCYDYTEPTLGVMHVCIPLSTSESIVVSHPLRKWYTEDLANFADSWVPLGINLAQGRSASQSSDDPSYPTPAGRAVDGSTDGNYFNNTVAHTGYSTHAWWEVDLGGVQWMDAVQVWNRTDCCAQRLKNFYLFISDEPFPSNDPSVLLGDPDVWHYQVSSQAGRPTTVAVNDHGRYVRVQLAGADYLDMAELQVYGMPGAPDQWPTARPAAVAGSGNTFQLTWPGQRQQTVNGQLVYTWQGSQIAVERDSGAGKFDVGLTQEGEHVTESATASKESLGMEIKSVGGEVTTGTTQKTSYILSWSNELVFSGLAGALSRDSSREEYAYQPYVWLQRATSSGGTNQAFMVLDYWVPPVGEAVTADAAPASEAPRSGLIVTPTVPLLNSPTHPDPATWYITNIATFTWTQPPGDPATVDGYRWYLDQTSDTVPGGANLGLTNAYTYRELADGVWTMHVRAMSDGGQWSDTAHRTIRVDMNPPEVRLAVAPARPTGNIGWYLTPVTVTVSATDTTGSGVAGVEVSTDGATWQPYNAPLAFTADTPGTTVYARATDAVGHLSVPISTTFKIDATPPNSHVDGGQGAGAWVARVITNTLGNQQLVLAGAIADHTSGRAGMALGLDGLDWTSASSIGSWHPFPGQPQIEVNWIFTATQQLGAGNHIFTGRAQDEAGNLEDAYEIGRVLWFPQASPDLAGSSLSASPTTVRPGEVVTFTLVARNAGWQEALVAITDTLPVGLIPVTATLASDVGYDPATRTMTWPPRLLWPGEWIRHSFHARAAASLPATTLENRATLHAFWPNTEILPPAQRQQFLDHEQTVVVTAAVAVAPSLPSGADVTPPWAALLRLSPQAVSGSQVRLGILAAPDARWMYVREWVPNPATGVWTVAQSSGWIDYARTYTSTLSSGQGVKYLGVWVADAATNISSLDEHSLIFVNRIDGSQTLANGQRVQYRGNVLRGAWVIATLTTVSGDPDLYIWKPYNGFRPDLVSNETVQPGQMENMGGRLEQHSGRFLLEVQSVGASEYQLDLAGHGRMPVAVTRTALVKPRPRHPLVISDPLSAGQVGTAVSLNPKIYLPVMVRND